MVSSAFLPARMTMTPPTASPLPSSSEMPRRISGPIWMRATSPSRIGVPRAPRPTGTVRKSSKVFKYPVARTAYCRLHLVDGDAERAHEIGIEHHLILLDQATDTGNFGDIRHALQLVLQEPILQSTQLRDVVFPAVIDECVLIDPADARAIGPQRRLCGRRQSAGDLVQVFEHARTRPIQVGLVIEYDVHVGIAKK